MHESRARLTIATAARDCFLMLAYTWKYQDDPQQGVMLLGFDQASRVATAAWGDSWHMNSKIMQCTGEISAAGVFDVRGTYAAPPGPDWGWRITLTRANAGAVELDMFNIPPQGDELIAVRARFMRSG